MKKVKEWCELLEEEYTGYDPDMFCHMEDDEYMSPFEVMDEVIQFNGGLADGYEVSELVNLLYNIDLEDC